MGFIWLEKQLCLSFLGIEFPKIWTYFFAGDFNIEDTLQILESHFESDFILRSQNHSIGIFSFIKDVKVDLVRHPHPLIRKAQPIDGIRMFSIEDIIAIKAQAILGRGKKKYFWDLSELLNHYSVADFTTFPKQKYSIKQLLISIPQAIIYFEDAEESEDPKSLKDQTWESVKKIIQQKVRAYLQ